LSNYLTPAQREVLRRFLVLLVVKLSSSNEITPDSEADPLCLDELQRLVAVAKQQSLSKQLAEIRQLLL
jgi:hypothetical protein